MCWNAACGHSTATTRSTTTTAVERVIAVLTADIGGAIGVVIIITGTTITAIVTVLGIRDTMIKVFAIGGETG